MRRIFSALISLLIIILGTLAWVQAQNVSLTVPTRDNGSAQVNTVTSTVQTNEESFLGFGALIVKYLWIVLVLAVFVALLYLGFMLMTSDSDSKTADLGTIFVSILGGVLIAIFSYAIIRLLIRLF